MGTLRAVLKHPDDLYPMMKLKLAARSAEKQIPAEPHWGFCYTMLHKVSRSFGLVIQQLDTDLRDAVCIFYLVLRALDTVEDDTSIATDVKVPILMAFHRHIYDREWHFSCGTKEYKVLMDEFHHVSTAFLELGPGYQEAIEDITMRMGAGMAKFICKEVETIGDYDEYCHYVAGLVGLGLSKLFHASGKEDLASDTLSNSMGLFLQKTNIIRDYLEDINEIPKSRMFWPREIWSKYVDKLEDLKYEENSAKAVQCLNDMVTNALMHVEDCLIYMSNLRDRAIFRFCAIPQIMAIGTLALCYNNIEVFRGVVKMRRGLTAKVIDRTNTMADVYGAFYDFSRMLKSKVDDNDPNANKTKERLESILKTCRESGALSNRKSYIIPSKSQYNSTMVILIFIILAILLSYLSASRPTNIFNRFCCFGAKAPVSSKVHIVYMGSRPLDEPEIVENSHHELLSGIVGSKEAASGSILYSYKHGFSGFAAVLTPSQARVLAGLPGVVRVIPHKIYELHTTRSWDFLQVNSQLTDGILLKGQSGSGSIVGVLDSGICPESDSFRDDLMMQDVPSRWKGVCQEGQEFNKSHCNKKIIGARWYSKGYESEFGSLNPKDGAEFLSPRDAEGHGTHTSSTVAGVAVQNANFLGLGQGLARGGAPMSWLAVYKVCWATFGCSSADILAAFDDAIRDGVDVISASLGILPPLATYVDDVVSIGSFHAVSRGITVVCSAGNSGPFPETVANTSPWLITVAASTIDRAFPVVIMLGNNQSLRGQSLYTNEELQKFYPLVYAEDITADDADGYDARSCTSGSLNATLAKGKVILCFETRTQRFASSAAKSVKEVEGIGIVFARYLTKEVNLCLDVPCVQVDVTSGTSLLTYMASTSDPIIKFNVPKTAIGDQVSPNIAVFSSRGPNSLSATVSKPDIAAPGVNILASWSAAKSAQPSGALDRGFPPFEFKFASGTSMACPHVSAVVALLKSVHPNWSPAAIKSALITTASTTDEYGEASIAEAAPHKLADPFDYGGGHVNPNKALNPGLIFDMETIDHVNFLCALGYNKTAISLMTRAVNNRACKKTNRFLVNYNLPSITIPELGSSAITTVSRIVTNVGPEISIYTARIDSPPGIDVNVEPSVLVFTSLIQKHKFMVTFSSEIKAQSGYSFGTLIWEDESDHVVKVPLIVRSVVQECYG